MIMCVLSGRLFDVPPLALDDRARLRLVGELPGWPDHR